MLHDITTLEELSHAGLIALYLQSNTESLEMRLMGKYINFWYSQTMKLSSVLKSSCQAADGKTFGTIVSALTSYSDSGRTLYT